MADPSTPPRERAAVVAALAEVLRATSANAVLFSQSIADRVGMNPTDLESLDLLQRGGPMTAGRLAEVTGLTTGAVTGLIDRLERLGFAHRQPDPGDRRRILVAADTEAIEQRLGPFFAPMAAATEELLAGFRDEELAIVLAFLERANAVATDQIARNREGHGERGGRGRGVRAWSRRQPVVPTGAGAPSPPRIEPTT